MLTGFVVLRMKTQCPPAQLVVTIEGYEHTLFREQTKPNQEDSTGKKRTFSEQIVRAANTL